jgi:hypothetical protein
MEIGTLFEFDSHGTIRQAIFKEDLGDRVKAVIYGDWRLQGTQVTINKSLIKF